MSKSSRQVLELHSLNLRDCNFTHFKIVFLRQGENQNRFMSVIMTDVLYYCVSNVSELKGNTIR